MANIIKSSIRKYDLICRYGGEEFILLLKGVISLDGTLKLCERIRSLVEEKDFDYAGNSIKTTISIGVCFEEDAQNLKLEDIISKADSALYESKSCGRNRITTYQPSLHKRGSTTGLFRPIPSPSSKN